MKQAKVKITKPIDDFSTEEKIKNAARIVFHKKGFAATRTRDIAEEAGINLALLNYYFRSKEKLFDIIILETLQGFLKLVKDGFNDETTTVENKVEAIVCNYIDLLTNNPDVPLFILSELRNNPGALIDNMGVKEIILESAFMRQFQQGLKEGKIMPMHPLQFIMSVMGMTIFPFVASPLVKGLGGLSDTEFNKLMQERKVLIPKWVKAMLKAK